MGENLEQPKSESERTPEQEAMLDVLESAFENMAKVELTVLEPNGQLRTSEVFVEGFESGMLSVSGSEKGNVISIPIGDVKTAKLAEKPEN